MGVTTLHLSEFSKLPDSEKRTQISTFLAARTLPVNGEVEFLDGKIAEFEKRYEMSSATMRNQICHNRLKETADICAWMMILDARQSLTE